MFKEKLHKKLAAALEKYQMAEPTALQAQCLSKINSGGDLIAVAPEGSGKSTLTVIATVQKLQRAFEDAPRALVMVTSKEKALAMKDLFDRLTEDSDLRAVCAFDEGKLDQQSDDIYTGTDLVIGTPKRLLELYLSRNLNMNKLKLFVMDDPELMIKSSWQGQIDRLGLSLPKCQHLVFTGDFNEKVEKLISKIVVAPHIVETDAP